MNTAPYTTSDACAILAMVLGASTFMMSILAFSLYFFRTIV